MAQCVPLWRSDLFIHGAVCPDYGNRTVNRDDAFDYLRGKHIIACDIEWPPYFSVHNSKNGKQLYSGLDMDMIRSLAELLGFNYTIRVPPSPSGNDTWTLWLLREIDNCDVIMSWWMKDPDRWNKMIYVQGHLDTAEYLVTKAPTYNLPPLHKRLLTFLEPFTPGLWAMIFTLAAVVCVHAHACGTSSCLK